ncbi:RHS repeat-associated core domain-containing protein [Pseudomonas sp. nanlin1]|uniref:RHS repeat-associated core domain-containing protein n=1 Tax=Pseudomonas sp. nanlin1 TaxID=3040605 RepID=UPI00388FD7D5
MQTISWLATDPQGSVLQVLSGHWQTLVYTAYGDTRGAEGGSHQLLYTSQVRELSGLYLLGRGHRSYSVTLRRFLQSDAHSPFEVGGLNGYAYCTGDPVNLTDPSGRAPGLAALVTLVTGRLGSQIPMLAANSVPYLLGTTSVATGIAAALPGVPVEARWALGAASVVSGAGAVFARNLSKPLPTSSTLPKAPTLSSMDVIRARNMEVSRPTLTPMNATEANKTVATLTMPGGRTIQFQTSSDPLDQNKVLLQATKIRKKMGG